MAAGSVPNVAGMVNDPEFLGLAPADQRDALSKLTKDDAFSQLSDGDTLQFVSKMTGGMNLRGSVPRPPVPQMQPSNVGIALGSGNNGIANPQQPAEQFAIQNPAQQGKLAMAAGIGAAGAGTVAGLPSAARAAIPPVLKIGQWAKENPVAAWMALEALKNAIPGFKSATELLKKSPVGH